MQPIPGDAKPNNDPATEANSTPPREISVNANAEALSTQLVTGDGDIHYAPTFHTGHEWVRSDEITSNQIAVAQSAFVPPPGYRLAWDRLIGRNVLIISAPAGTGKKTTALNLLAELRYPRAEREQTRRADPDLGLRELDEDWQKPRVSKLPRFPHQGLLLDLSDSVDQAPDEEFGIQLVDYAKTIAAIGSFLVILATPEVWKACAGATSALTEDDLGHPTARALVHARLTHSSSPWPQRARWLDDDHNVAKVLENDLHPDDADHLYQAITASDDTPDGPGKAVDQFHGWHNHLSDWWKEEKSEHGPYERAMQIVAATVGRASAGDILTLTDEFLKKARHEDNVHLPLSGPDLSERLRRVDLMPAEDGLVELDPGRPRIRGAVLDHVWSERPQIHDDYQNWIMAVTKSGQVGKKYVEQIADSITGIGIRRKSVEFLDLIEAWVTSQPDQVTLATRMLEDTCLDPVVGAQVRRRLRDWAEQKSTPDPLVTIVITICRGQLGVERTVVALTRLKKILQRANADTFMPQVSAAVTAIASYPGRLSAVLAEVVEWLDDDTATPGRIGFLALMNIDPDMNAEDDSPTIHLLNQCRHDSELHRVLTGAWHTVVYANPNDRDVVAAIRNLLAFATKNREFVDITVSILGPAIQGSLKTTIAGKVLLNHAIDSDDSGDTAYAKLLDVLFDETRHTTSTTSIPVSPPEPGVSPATQTIDNPLATDPASETDGDPQAATSWSGAVTVHDETPTTEGDGRHWIDPNTTTMAYPQPEPPAPSAPTYPAAPAPPPPDEDRGEKRGWFRR